MTSLADPVQVGRRVARNRVVFGPHETNLARRRALSARHVAYYRARAAGGAGVIVVEEASVDDSDWPYERAPLAAHAAEGWSHISSACRDEGALVIAALGHAGGQGSSAYHQRFLLGPSRAPDVASREAPKEMEADEIETLVASFAKATAAALAAGCDGVELNAGQHSLLRQFCSGLTNLRDDGFGTDRSRLLWRVLEAARAAADRAESGGIVGLRLSCDELAPWAGITPESASDLVRAVTPVGLDYLCVVRGSAFGTSATRPDGHVEPGFNRRSAAIVRSGLPQGVALVAQGSIVDVPLAEELVAGGEADLVEMTRAQIADPSLGRKVTSGAGHRVRPCVLCNQGCQVRDVRNPLVTCVGEPTSGHETTDPFVDLPFVDLLLAAPDPPLADPPILDLTSPALEGAAGRSWTGLLVIGGGPAGLECARVAAAAGLDVTLLEREPRVGGMVRVAAQVPGRERLAKLVDWLESECHHAGVRIVTDHEVTLEEIDSYDGPIVHCTGSRPGRRTFEVAHGAAVATAAEVLAAERWVAEPPPSPVVVWDPIGGPIGVGVAELLATHGAAVSLVTPDHVVGEQLARSGDLAPANVRLQQRGVVLVRRSVMTQVDPLGATVEHRYSGERRLLDAVLCVDSGYLLPEDLLWRASGARHARAGDAVAPRSIYEAVLEGRRVALGLGRAGTPAAVAASR